MKRIWSLMVIWSLLVIGSMAFGQKVESLDTQWLFNNTSYEDSVALEADSGYYILKSPTAAGSTATTRKFEIKHGGADITLYGRVWNVVATMNTTLEFGVWGGPEYGWIKSTVGTFTTDTTFYFNYPADATRRYTVTDSCAIFITNTGAQKNKWALRLKRFLWK